MKIALIVPVKRGVLWVLPPIGLGYLAHHLAGAGHDVRLLDGALRPFDGPAFADFLRRFAPDVVGITAFSTDLQAVDALLAAVREILPRCLTVLGGPHASAVEVGALTRFPQLDFAVVGEGEIAFSRLVAHLGGGGDDPRAISGLVYRSGGVVAVNPVAFLEDLDALGFPDWGQSLDLLDYRGRLGHPFQQTPLAAPLMISRGCPCRCAYCVGHKIMGRKVRYRTLPHVMREIDLLIARYGVREFSIVDDNMTEDKGFVLAFCRALRERGRDIRWCTFNGMRLATVDEEILLAMKGSGCRTLVCGVESGSPRILRAMRRPATTDLVLEKTRLARTCGLDVHGFFIVGYPGETREDMGLSADLMRAAPFTSVSIGCYVPLPGSETRAEMEAAGAVSRNEEGDFASLSAPRYAPAGMTLTDVKRVQQWMLLRFYVRPAIFLGRLRFLAGSRCRGRLLLLMLRYFFGR